MIESNIIIFLEKPLASGVYLNFEFILVFLLCEEINRRSFVPLPT